MNLAELFEQMMSIAPKLDNPTQLSLGRILTLLEVLVEARQRGREDVFDKHITSVIAWVCGALTPRLFQLEQDELIAVTVLSEYATDRDPRAMLENFKSNVRKLPSGSEMIALFEPLVKSSVKVIVASWGVPKCDGNHGGPPCADPGCWSRDPSAQRATDDGVPEHKGARDFSEQLRAMGLKP